MKKINIYFVAVAVSGFLMSGCSNSKATDDKEKPETVFEASVVKATKVSRQITLPGELQGYYETGIIAKVNGYIKTLLVDIGDRVKEGQLLAELEAPELVSQLISAYAEFRASEAIYLNAGSKYARLKQTNKTPGAVSPYDMDVAKTTLTSDSLTFLAAKAKYESFKQLADYLKITAPFDGLITERALAPGAFVGPNDKNGMPLLRLKQESKLRLHVAVPEKHLAEVSVGESVTFHVKSFPDEIFQGKITRLSKNLNLVTRSETVEIEVNNANGKLLPGMYAIASIPLKRSGLSIVVPQTAVLTNMEKQFVIKIKHSNEVTYIDVEKGEDQKEGVEVFGDIFPGDTILNTASDEIRQKSIVKILVVDEVVKK
jgi:membrane fusion protein, multidrug efflux system